MVALVTRGVDDRPIGIHRTFLARDGSGKAPVEPAKMMLGPCRGGAVRLGAPSNFLMVGEGMETCLAAMQATGGTRPGQRSPRQGCVASRPPDHSQRGRRVSRPTEKRDRSSTGSLRPRRCFARTAPFSAPKDTMRRPACGSRTCRISTDAIPDHPTRRQAQSGARPPSRERRRPFCFADAASDFEGRDGPDCCGHEQAALVGTNPPSSLGSSRPYADPACTLHPASYSGRRPCLVRAPERACSRAASR